VVQVFAAVGGALADGSRHLNTDVISWTLREVAPDVRCVAIVGDRGIDMLGGQDHGLAGIGVRWGYGTEGELMDAGAISVLETPMDPVDILEALP
jgi:phosphoglycolate phosphatase